MTPQGQTLEMLFWVMVFGPSILLAAVAAFTGRSWLIWGVGALLATLILLLLADEIGASYWNGLAERGYDGDFIAAARAASTAAAVTSILLAFMILTRTRPAAEPVSRQEPAGTAPAIGVSGTAELGRVPPEVFATLLAREQLDAVLEAEADGDRIRLQRRGGGTLGFLPRLQGTEVAMLARKGGRLKFWVTECLPGAADEPGRVEVAYEESARGSRIPVETASSATTPATVLAPVGASPPPTTLRREPVAEAAPPAGGNIASQLATLASLKDSGALSEAEFDAAKRRVLQL